MIRHIAFADPSGEGETSPHLVPKKDTVPCVVTTVTLTDYTAIDKTTPWSCGNKLQGKKKQQIYVDHVI